jgi:hypothetical protein
MVGNSGTVDADAAKKARLASKSTRTAVSSGGGERRASKGANFEDIMREPGQTARLQSLMDYYADLDPTLFAEAAGKLDNLPFSERMLAGYLLFSRWAEVDPVAALAHADSMGRGGFMVRPAILQSWASSDPQGAARYYEENPRDFAMMGGFGGRGGGTSAAGQIAAEWAKQDPQGALTWAQGLEGRDASSAVGSIFRQLASEDPARAAEMAAGLSEEERAGAYRSIAREWGEKDWSSAEAWVSSLPASEQAAAMAEAVRGLAGEDPKLAALQISKISDGDARDEAIRSVAENWSREDPAAAAEWMMAQDSDKLEGPMREVVSNWTNKDAAGALAFVNAQPEGELRDTAAATYVYSNRDGDIAQSLELAESIGDDESRSQVITMTTMRWMREDKDAAMAYIEATESLGEDTKERIIQRAEGGGDDRGDRGGRGRGGR